MADPAETCGPVGQIQQACVSTKKKVKEQPGGEQETDEDFEESWVCEDGWIDGTLYVTHKEGDSCTMVIRIERHGSKPLTKEAAGGQTKAITGRGFERLLIKCEGEKGGDCKGTFQICIARRVDLH